jgi:hypothetical protein
MICIQILRNFASQGKAASSAKNATLNPETSSDHGIRNPESGIPQNPELFRIPNSEYRIPNTEYRIPNTEYRIPNTEYRIPNTVSTTHKYVVMSYIPVHTVFIISSLEISYQVYQLSQKAYQKSRSAIARR